MEMTLQEFIEKQQGEAIRALQMMTEIGNVDTNSTIMDRGKALSAFFKKQDQEKAAFIRNLKIQKLTDDTHE